MYDDKTLYTIHLHGRPLLPRDDEVKLGPEDLPVTHMWWVERSVPCPPPINNDAFVYVFKSVYDPMLYLTL